MFAMAEVLEETDTHRETISGEVDHVVIKAESGDIDVVPEYVGNLLAFYDAAAAKPGDDLDTLTDKLRAEATKKKRVDVKKVIQSFLDSIIIELGKGKDRVLTCDLTKEYVAINGDYRS